MTALVKSEVVALPPRSPVRYLPSAITLMTAFWMLRSHQQGAREKGGRGQRRGGMHKRKHRHEVMS